MGELQTLQECYNEADPGLLRSAFGRLVSKVELWFGWKPSTRGGTRQTAVPKRGLIHLRPDLQIVKLVSGDTSRTFSLLPTLRPSRTCLMANWASGVGYTMSIRPRSTSLTKRGPAVGDDFRNQFWRRLRGWSRKAKRACVRICGACRESGPRAGKWRSWAHS